MQNTFALLSRSIYNWIKNNVYWRSGRKDTLMIRTEGMIARRMVLKFWLHFKHFGSKEDANVSDCKPRAKPTMNARGIR